MNTQLATDFAPAERVGAEAIERQAGLFAASPMLGLLGAIPIGLLIINEHRQTVFCNPVFQEMARKRSPQELLGMRPGEALGCIHSDISPGGCGTTKFCQYCGAAKAILGSLRGAPMTDECRILRHDDLGDEALDLQVFASPFQLEGTDFLLFTVLDISHEKRLQCLERIFFHDILNLVTGLKYSVQTLRAKPPAKETLDRALAMHDAALTQMAEEIQMQRNLTHAEQGRLMVMPVQTNTREILDDLQIIYSVHKVALQKTLVISRDSQPLDLRTDPALVGRVMGNLIKNALEASGPNDTVVIGCAPAGDCVEFWVRNQAVMDEHVQRQMFKRSFSTKGEGRGLGSYSVKLLTERYLNGSARFVSDPEHGTIFTIRLPRKPPA